jgi:hypothetical protein
MSKDRNYEFREELPTRESEPPTHKRRREIHKQLREIVVEDLDELDDFEIETFEPIKKNGGRNR